MPSSGSNFASPIILLLSVRLKLTPVSCFSLNFWDFLKVNSEMTLKKSLVTIIHV